MISRHEQIKQEVSAWDDVSANPHRFGGTEFNIGNVEVGHVHGDRMVDIPFTVKIREHLVADGEASHHHLLADSGWISFYLRKDEDVAQAVKLLRISYLQKRLSRAKGDVKAQYTAEVERLPISAGLKGVLLKN
jgi:hypothetical protein